MTDRRWQHKPFEEHDVGEILSLRARIFNDPDYGRDRWNWQYRDNPMGRSYIDLAVDQDQSDLLAGHYAVISYNVTSNAKKIRAVQSLDTFTNPSYQRQGIFVELAEKTYQSAKDDGVELVFGFPNQNSYLGFVKKLGFIDPFGFVVYKLPLKTGYFTKRIPGLAWLPQIPLKFITLPNDISLEEVTALPEDFGDALTGFQSIAPMMVERSESYLNWRYFSCPDRTYRCHIMKKLGRTVAALFAQVDRKSNYVHFVDFIVKQESYFEPLIKAGVKFYSGEDQTCITVFLNEGNLIAKILEKMRFHGVDKSLDSRFILRSLAGSPLDSMSRGRVWFITGGDTDFY